MASQASRNQVLSVFDLLGLARPSGDRLDRIASEVEAGTRTITHVRDALLDYIATSNGISNEEAVRLVIGGMFERAGVAVATSSETATARIARISREFLDGTRTLNEINRTILSFAQPEPPREPTSRPTSDAEPDSDPTPDPASAPDDTAPRDFFAEAQRLFPGIPRHLLRVYADEWEETGNQDLALAAMRADPRYDDFFAGNRRDDGTFRLSESDYIGRIHGYESLIRNEFALNPNLYRSRFGDLIAGDVSVGMLEQRLRAVEEGLVNNIDEVREAYAARWGVNLSDRALFAAALDPDVGSGILQRRITEAQISGEGLARGFALDEDFTERLASGGVNQSTARQFFSQAESTLPNLDALARRYRVGQGFTLENLADASIFGDATSRRRLSRAMQAEASSFTQREGVFAQDQGFAITGLRQR